MNEYFNQNNPFNRPSLKSRDLYTGEAHIKTLDQIKSKLIREKKSKSYPNFLITGERGVGKSSLVNIIKNESDDFGAIVVDFRIQKRLCNSYWEFYFQLFKNIIENIKPYLDSEDQISYNNLFNKTELDYSDQVLAFVSSYHSSISHENSAINPSDIINDLKSIIENIEGRKIMILIDEANFIYDKPDIIAVMRDIIDCDLGISFILAGEPIGINSSLNKIFGDVKRHFEVIELTFFSSILDIINYFKVSLKSIGWKEKDIDGVKSRYFPKFLSTMFNIFQLTHGDPVLVTIIAREMYYQSADTKRMKLSETILEKIATDYEASNEPEEIIIDKEEDIKLVQTFSRERVDYILQLSDDKLKWLVILINNQVSPGLKYIFDVYKFQFSKSELNSLEELKSFFNELVYRDVFLKYYIDKTQDADKEEASSRFFWFYKGLIKELKWLSISFKRYNKVFYHRYEKEFWARFFDSINKQLDFSSERTLQLSNSKNIGFDTTGVKTGIEFGKSRVKDFFIGLSNKLLDIDSISDVDNKAVISFLTFLNQSSNDNELDIDILYYSIYFKTIDRYVGSYFYAFYNAEKPINSPLVRNKLNLIKSNVEHYNEIDFHFHIEIIKHSEINHEKFFQLVLDNDDLPMENQHVCIEQVIKGMISEFTDEDIEFKLSAHMSKVELIIKKLTNDFNLTGLYSHFNSLAYALIKFDELDKAFKILNHLNLAFQSFPPEKHEMEALRYVKYNLAVVQALSSEYEKSIELFNDAALLEDEGGFHPDRMYVINHENGIFYDKSINDNFDYVEICYSNIQIIKEKFL